MINLSQSLRLVLATGAMLLVAGNANAVDAGQTDQGAENVRASLAQKLPDLKADSITPSAIPGLYEVMFGPRLLYISADGRYLVDGDMTDLETGDNLTEPKLNAAKIKAVESVGEDKMVIFGAKDAPHTISVFTDIDCGYCRKLHAEIPQYNAAGIRVRYLFYPRSGLGGESYEKAVSVWCSDDQLAAMTAAKSGQTLPKKTCDNPVAEHFMLGQLLGLRGTPALVMESGEMIPGYVPPARLKKLLEEKSAGAN